MERLHLSKGEGPGMPPREGQGRKRESGAAQVAGSTGARRRVYAGMRVGETAIAKLTPKLIAACIYVDADGEGEMYSILCILCV